MDAIVVALLIVKPLCGPCAVNDEYFAVNMAYIVVVVTSKPLQHDDAV